jgi:hypothetical protein
MGMLDEAIREHLELKRLRGADPGELARVEREALDPVIPNQPETWGADGTASGTVAASGAPLDAGAQAAPAVPEELPASADGGGEASGAEAGPGADVATDVPPSQDFSNVGQETAEIDMEAVMAADGDEGGPAASDATAGDGASSAGGGAESTGDSFEWEMPADGRAGGFDGSGRTAAEGDGTALGDGADTDVPPEQIPGQESMSFE